MDSDTDLRSSVLLHVGGAVLLIILVAVMFGVIGTVGSGDGGSAADEGEVPEAAEVSAGELEQPAEELESVAGSESGSETEPEPEPDPEPQPDPEPEPEPDPPVEAIAPEDITVQVLDGYRVDGGTAASGVAEQLEEAGYRIVARNPALTYDVTAVLWTSDNEEAARQIAAAIDAAEVREQPGTLSEAVAVHVVVGADRG